jgi:ribosome-associated protein
MESVWSASAAGRAASRAEGDDYDNDEHRALFHPAFRMTARPAADAASDDRDVAAAAERPSKTKRKAESHDLQALGESLLELGDDHLASLGLDETLVEAIRAARKMRSHEARRRQLQLIGKLMRSADVALARGAVAERRLGRARDSLALHEAERWRAELIADDAATTRFAKEHADADVQQLRTLVRNARKDAASVPEQRSGRAFRELFRFIREQQGHG